MASEDVIVRLQVAGQGQFAQAMRDAKGETEGVATGQQQAAQSSRSVGREMLKSAAVAGVMVKAYKGLKGAVDVTAQLAKDTAAFSRASGLSSKESQNWVVLAQQRGIQTKQLQVGMATLGRNLGVLGGSTKASSKMFAQLGLSQARLLKMPMQERMAAIADAFSRMPDGVNKAALAQRIFGRAGQQLLPLLNDGAAGLNEQMKAARDLVPPLDATGKSALDMAKQQRTMRMAMMGLQTTIGTALIPILTSLTQAVSPILQAFTRLLRTAPWVSDAIVALAAAVGTLMIVQRVGAMMQAFGIATSVSLGPVGLIAAAVVGLGVALVMLYNKVGWFRAGVNAAFGAVKTAAVAAFGWIKRNWPLLLAILTGPFGVAVGLIIRNFSTIKNTVSTSINAIVGFVNALPGRVAAAGRNAFNSIKQGITDAANWVWRQVNWIIDRIREIPSRIGNIFGNIGGSIAGGVRDLLPFSTGGVVAAQSGMTATGGRTALVGERGPEILSLPSGSRVTPLPPPTLSPSQLLGGGRPIITQVFLDRRQIAEAIGSLAADQQAAR